MATIGAGDDPALDDEAARALDAEAERILYEYVLVRFHGLTLQGLGYHTGDGVTVWARKVDEHALCHWLVTAAIDEVQHGEVR